MQALQWGASFPDQVGRIVAMTPMLRTSAWSQAVNEASRLALMADPAWTGRGFVARPDRGFKAWTAMMRVLANRTPAALEAAATPLARLIEETVENGTDPADWIYQTWAYDAHDVGDPARIPAPTLVLAPALDLYNPAEAAREAARLLPRGRFVEIPTRDGHQAAGPPAADFLNHTIAAFLREPAP
jgi:homoserine O-acetyltransferase